jgi:hypothetical protein
VGEDGVEPPTYCEKRGPRASNLAVALTLSYSPKMKLEGETGLEPVTFDLVVAAALSLSYSPIEWPLNGVFTLVSTLPKLQRTKF